MKTEPEYLGGGVYVKFDGYQIRLDAVHLDASDHASSDTIFLDARTWVALVDYANEMFAVQDEDTMYGNCSMCGKPMYDWQFQGSKPHPYEGGGCHDECCPACSGGETPHAA